ncbi:hypothetical protein [uncultured Nevskia sp.]|uniref:hypothetical protein n=1 Tax=uncultured Nevskia sp. TaxID=228950 RepID=UPI0025F6258F|nr:hypothetical protein [uncultured Nevskia sp.]
MASYTLNCSGDGGSSSQTITLTVNPAPKRGGGAVDWLVLLIGAAAAGLQRRKRAAKR